jgi:hypothetical protein
MLKYYNKLIMNNDTTHIEKYSDEQFLKIKTEAEKIMEYHINRFKNDILKYDGYTNPLDHEIKNLTFMLIGIEIFEKGFINISCEEALIVLQYICEGYNSLSPYFRRLLKNTSTKNKNTRIKIVEF